ncbi:MAG: pentapeptide repeat-containing protein [Alphaproteobacteria bacterium]|nr:pentapeptide repeat-containing protein [Alphaproteobacteria bacterium]MBP7763038.1 pentapeptide repeat-containing protein [Alphaproteobacteria bacterium]
MPSSEAFDALKSGKSAWEAYRASAFKNGAAARLVDGRIDLRSADLSYMDLSCFDLSRVDFSSADDGFPTLLSGAKLSDAYLFGSRFSGTRFAGADLSGSNIAGAEFDSVSFDERSSLRSAKGNGETVFRRCSLGGVDLSGAKLTGADFSGSTLTDTDLSGVNFVSARLGGTSWERARIDEKTKFDLAHFSDHPVTLDQSESMIVPGGLNWKNLRWIGSLRLMPVSIFGLAGCFLLLSAVKATSADPQAAIQFSAAGITPVIVHLLMIAFSFLFTGAYLFSLRCPEEVKEFSIAQWVYLAKNPRPVYLAKTLQGRAYALASFLLVLAGFALLLFSLKAVVLSVLCGSCL